MTDITVVSLTLKVSRHTFILYTIKLAMNM